MGRIEAQVAGKHLSPEDLEQRALTLRTIGWLLLVFDAIIAVFVFVGIRDGSLLWFYWTVIEGIFGAGFILAGLHRQENADQELAHMSAHHEHGAGEPEQPKAA
jgi:hypothetical protein